MDQPDLTDEQAEEKLQKIMDEKKERMNEMMPEETEALDGDMNARSNQDESDESDTFQRN
jgi:hypothetical protein